MAESAPVKKPKAAPTHPKTLEMVVEAIKTIKDTKGSSVQAIKAFILSHYPTVSPSHLTANLRRALKAGLDSGVLVRPKGSTATGATGRLRVGKLTEKPKKKPAKKKAPVKKKTVKKPKEKKSPKKAKDAKKPKKSKPSATKPKEKKTAKKGKDAKKTTNKTSTKKTGKTKTTGKVKKTSAKKPSTKKSTNKGPKKSKATRKLCL